MNPVETRSYLVIPKSSPLSINRSLLVAKEAVQHLGGTVEKEMTSFTGFTAILSTDARKKLTDEGFSVIENKRLPQFPTKEHQSAPVTFAVQGNSEVNVINQDELLETMSENRFFKSMHVNSHFTGKGVSIAILDTGISPHPDLEGRIAAFRDFVNGERTPYDDSGHGTHVAGIIAGSGKLSHGDFKGTAPGANIVALKVVEGTGGGMFADSLDRIVAALDWVVANKDRYNIRVVNMSLGLPLVATGEDFLSGAIYAIDPLRQAVNRVVASGITVVTAAGNSGRGGEGTLMSTPAINPNVITVGATDDKNTPDRSDDEVAEFSSAGPAPNGVQKPDILAPGVNIMSCNTPEGRINAMNNKVGQIRDELKQMGEEEVYNMVEQLAYYGLVSPRLLDVPPERLRRMLLEDLRERETAGPYFDNSTPAYIALDGTSMASPAVAGTVADMLEANPSLTPQQIKEILRHSSFPVGGPRDRFHQGAGELDGEEAIKMAQKAGRRVA